MIGVLSLWLCRRRLPGWSHVSEIARTVQDGDDLHEPSIIENTVDEAIALVEGLADRIVVSGLRNGATAARQGGEAFDRQMCAAGLSDFVEPGAERNGAARK